MPNNDQTGRFLPESERASRKPKRWKSMAAAGLMLVSSYAADILGRPVQSLLNLNQNNENVLSRHGARQGLESRILGSLTREAAAADVTFAWDPNPESDLEGYGFYKCDTAIGGCEPPRILPVMTNPRFTMNVPDGRVFYFKVRAFNTEKKWSGDSNIVSFAKMVDRDVTVTSDKPVSVYSPPDGRYLRWTTCDAKGISSDTGSVAVKVLSPNGKTYSFPITLGSGGVNTFTAAGLWLPSEGPHKIEFKTATGSPHYLTVVRDTIVPKLTVSGSSYTATDANTLDAKVLLNGEEYAISSSGNLFAAIPPDAFDRQAMLTQVMTLSFADPAGNIVQKSYDLTTIPVGKFYQVPLAASRWVPESNASAFSISNAADGTLVVKYLPADLNALGRITASLGSMNIPDDFLVRAAGTKTTIKSIALNYRNVFADPKDPNNTAVNVYSPYRSVALGSAIPLTHLYYDLSSWDPVPATPGVLDATRKISWIVQPGEYRIGPTFHKTTDQSDYVATTPLHGFEGLENIINTSGKLTIKSVKSPYDNTNAHEVTLGATNSPAHYELNWPSATQQGDYATIYASNTGTSPVKVSLAPKYSSLAPFTHEFTVQPGQKMHLLYPLGPTSEPLKGMGVRVTGTAGGKIVFDNLSHHHQDILAGGAMLGFYGADDGYFISLKEKN